MEAVDLLVRHGHVITMDNGDRIIPDGVVAIARRRIVDVGEDAALVGRYRATRTIDAAGAPVHPGLVESHAHASFHLAQIDAASHALFRRIGRPVAPNRVPARTN